MVVISTGIDPLALSLPPYLPLPSLPLSMSHSHAAQVPSPPRVTSGACVVPPPPWLVLVLPPLLLGGNTLRLLPWRLLSDECEAKSLGAALCCSAGRGRLLFKQHQVSWGSALSEGKEHGASQLLGVPKWCGKAKFCWPRDKPWGLVKDVKKQCAWEGKQAGSLSLVSEEGPSRAFLGDPSFWDDVQGFKRLSYILDFAGGLSMQRQ